MTWRVPSPGFDGRFGVNRESTSKILQNLQK
jgi:hypothetical protein